MVTFASECTTREGVTLVTAALTDVAVPTRVTLANRLDGPVWPPRREGLPACGWTDTGFEAVVGPGRHAFGYASPAPPADPAVELVEARPAPDAEPTRDVAQTPEAVCRDLGDPSPPADALPAVALAGDETSREAADAGDAAHDLPAPVAGFFEAAERRVHSAEALAEAETLAAATDAVRDAGGLDDVYRLDDRQGVDVRTLRAIARRAEALAERRAAATVPTDSLEGLA
ncbi:MULTISPECIES: hypothetical protein [Haloarcula]|uniref:DUF7857 domain-containing protein n=1 Tax=Haloarcula TaxID=2237 RepID=UPI0023ECDA1E|nr:hypothetical protein [Halomicroarcula sp. XH51]